MGLSVMLFLQYLWCALNDFHQTFVTSASWEKDELFSFWGQRVKGRGHSVTKYAKITIFEVCFCDISGMC